MFAKQRAAIASKVPVPVSPAVQDHAVLPFVAHDDLESEDDVSDSEDAESILPGEGNEWRHRPYEMTSNMRYICRRRLNGCRKSFKNTRYAGTHERHHCGRSKKTAAEKRADEAEAARVMKVLIQEFGPRKKSIDGKKFLCIRQCGSTFAKESGAKKHDLGGKCTAPRVLALHQNKEDLDSRPFKRTADGEYLCRKECGSSYTEVEGARRHERGDRCESRFVLLYRVRKESATQAKVVAYPLLEGLTYCEWRQMYMAENSALGK